jgi:hypothetical protein
MRGSAVRIGIAGDFSRKQGAACNLYAGIKCAVRVHVTAGFVRLTLQDELACTTLRRVAATVGHLIAAVQPAARIQIQNHPKGIGACTDTFQ